MSEYDKRATALQGVSALLALPQWCSNERLSFLLDNGETPDGKSLKDVRLPTHPHPAVVHQQHVVLTGLKAVQNACAVGAALASPLLAQP